MTDEERYQLQGEQFMELNLAISQLRDVGETLDCMGTFNDSTLNNDMKDAVVKRANRRYQQALDNVKRAYEICRIICDGKC